AVRDAVAAIENAGDPEAYVASVATTLPIHDPDRKAKTGQLQKLPTPTRLALEMALHEEQERRALAGELIELELAWRAAEEVAAIADNMFVPAEHEAFIAAQRADTDAGDERNH
ncbi:MAG: hypothetical protein OEY20_05860, partial [Gemmatimonadota bacterium]|nr:hypothetical protein [Gemmatimonadota bacterium]